MGTKLDPQKWLQLAVASDTGGGRKVEEGQVKVPDRVRQAQVEVQSVRCGLMEAGGACAVCCLLVSATRTGQI